MTDQTVSSIIIPTKSMLKTFNCFLFKADGAYTLVDACIDDDEVWEFFKERLSELKIEVNEINRIVITHNHADHIGLIGRIREINPSVKVYSHPRAVLRLRRESSFMQMRIRFFEDLYRSHGAESVANKTIERMKQSLEKNKHLAIEEPIYPLVEGDFVGPFKVIEVPGHAIDHIALYHSKTKELISSDLALEHSSSNALVEPDKNGQLMPTLVMYEASLKRVLDLEIERVYPGHGPVVNEQASELFEKRLNSIERKGHRIKEQLKTSAKTAAEIAQIQYKDRYESLFQLVMSEVIGHLERLVHQGELQRFEQDGLTYYKVKEG